MKIGDPVIYDGVVYAIKRNRNNGMYDLERIINKFQDPELPFDFVYQREERFCVYENEMEVCCVK